MDSPPLERSLPFLLFDVAELCSFVIQSEFPHRDDSIRMASKQFTHLSNEIVFVAFIEFIAARRMITAGRVQIVYTVAMKTHMSHSLRAALP